MADTSKRQPNTDPWHPVQIPAYDLPNGDHSVNIHKIEHPRRGHKALAAISSSEVLDK